MATIVQRTKKEDFVTKLPKSKTFRTIQCFLKDRKVVFVNCDFKKTGLSKDGIAQLTVDELEKYIVKKNCKNPQPSYKQVVELMVSVNFDEIEVSHNGTTRVKANELNQFIKPELLIPVEEEKSYYEKMLHELHKIEVDRKIALKSQNKAKTRTVKKLSDN